MFIGYLKNGGGEGGGGGGGGSNPLKPLRIRHCLSCFNHTTVCNVYFMVTKVSEVGSDTRLHSIKVTVNLVFFRLLVLGEMLINLSCIGKKVHK